MPHSESCNYSNSEHLKLIAAAQDGLKQAHAIYSEHNPLSHQAYESSCKDLPGGNTRTVLHALPFPLTFASGSGCTLTSVDGHTYTDFLGEYTAGIYGHNNPTIRAAVDGALDHGWSFGGNNMHEKELARLVCERFSPTMELVRFTNSGTEANMMAVATAIAWTGRKKILVFDKGYHGATLSFRAVPEGKATKTINLPHEWVIGEYNNIVATEKALSNLPAGSLAAIIVEPMLGSGGAIPGSLHFLHFLRSYSTSLGALLIFDEVMTSRLAYSGLGHKLGIQSDLMTLGKWVGGGMSFGAFGGRRDIMGMFDPRSGMLAHAGTFNNNVLSMAAGCAGCKLLDMDTTNWLNCLGEELKASVQDVINSHLAPQVPLTNRDAKDVSKVSYAPDGNGDDVNGLSLGEQTHLRHQYGGSPLKMWISGIGSILVVHFAPSMMQSTLQSLYYHHMLSEKIYLAERGFIALNIELRKNNIEAFVAATGRFVEKHKGLVLGAQ